MVQTGVFILARDSTGKILHSYMEVSHPIERFKQSCHDAISGFGNDKMDLAIEELMWWSKEF
jgi:hypothetical protein